MLTILQKSAIIPVIVIEHAQDAIPLAEAILSGGISVLEITLRTPAALEAIKQIRARYPEITVGAGTVMNIEQLKEAQAAGASFAVSPGLSPSLVKYAGQLRMPYLPGATTATEAMQAIELQLAAVKFFPAEAFGGVKTLKAYSQVFPQLTFCPTGGITPQNVRDYLALSNVKAVGGTWLTPAGLLKQRNWAAVTQLVKEALTLIA